MGPCVRCCVAEQIDGRQQDEIIKDITIYFPTAAVQLYTHVYTRSTVQCTRGSSRQERACVGRDLSVQENKNVTAAA